MTDYNTGTTPSNNQMTGTVEGVESKMELTWELGLQLTLSPVYTEETPVRTIPEMRRSIP